VRRSVSFLVVTGIALSAGLAPAWAQSPQQKLEPADNQGGDWLGWSVALWGDAALLGAPFDSSAAGQGSVHVYERTPTGWIDSQELVSTDPEGGHHFGMNLALDGTTALVADPWDDDLGAFSGSVHVFERRSSSWVITQKLLASNGKASDQFGSSVALDQRLAVVVGGRAAYVFERTASGWVESARLSGAGQDTSFGSAAVSENTILLGTPWSDAPLFQSGRVYCFERNPVGWVQTQVLVPNDPGFQGHFGASLAIWGDRALIGAPWRQLPTGEGAVYVFERGPSGWAQTAQLVDASGHDDDRFGESVALWEERALIGAPYADLGRDTTGAAYLFEPAQAGWKVLRELHARDAEHNERFGCSVALYGSTALLGDFADTDPGFFSGAGYVLSIP
jgi:FG-GAP repeat